MNINFDLLNDFPIALKRLSLLTITVGILYIIQIIFFKLKVVLKIKIIFILKILVYFKLKILMF